MTKLAEEIQRLNASEKLVLLELIWDDLASDPDQIVSPSWHNRELKKREERIRNGESTFSDWSEARERILKTIS